MRVNVWTKRRGERRGAWAMEKTDECWLDCPLQLAWKALSHWVGYWKQGPRRARVISCLVADWLGWIKARIRPRVAPLGRWIRPISVWPSHIRCQTRIRICPRLPEVRLRRVGGGGPSAAQHCQARHVPPRLVRPLLRRLTRILLVFPPRAFRFTFASWQAGLSNRYYCNVIGAYAFEYLYSFSRG